jgi:hypothetical protein
MKITGILIIQFKGIMSLNEPNLNDIVNVSGGNECGKTTIANAIIWCLFGKDIEGRTNFEIMPLDANNIMVPQMEPTVLLEFDIDGRNKTFKRVMTQKWIKKRGQETAIFDGSCESEYFVDGVPMKQKDFMEHVNDLCNEDVFRCITLPSYFASLEWKKRRDIITSIVGDVDVAKVNKDFADLVEKLNGRKIEDYRLVIAREKKGYKDEKDRIPEGIKASQKFLEGAEDWTEIERDINVKKVEIQMIEKKITNKSAVLNQYNKTLQKNAEKVRVWNQKKQTFIDNWTKNERDKKSKLQTEISKIEIDIDLIKINVKKAERSIEENKEFISSKTERINNFAKEREANKKKWEALNKSEFKEPEDGKCGSCGQDIILSYDEIEKLREKFNLDKANNLLSIVDQNKPLIKSTEFDENVIKEANAKILRLNQNIEGLNFKIIDTETEATSLKKDHSSIDLDDLESEAKELNAYTDIDIEIEKLTLQKAPSVDASEFTKEKQAVQIEIDALRARLTKRDTINKASKSIGIYETRFKELAQKIVSLEGWEFQTEKYEKALMSDLETKVNSRFQGISFKMFETQINQGIKPTCVILINGVPYNAANTAARIQAGIQIINVLSDYYNVTAPILIDNRESVIEIPKTKSQIFNMTVIEGQKLKIS